jgi:hypothetical protein
LLAAFSVINHNAMLMEEFMSKENSKDNGRSEEKKKEFDVIDNLAKWRVDPDYLKAAATKKQITRIPIRKPDRQQFIRVHADPEYHFSASIIDYEETREKFIVLPEVAKELAGEVKNVVLYTYTTRSGDLFLWPIKSLVDLAMSNPWIETAHQAAVIAKEKWIRVVANQNARSYDILEPVNPIPDPTWPELSMIEILNIAFRGRIVTTLDDEIILKLKGANL